MLLYKSGQQRQATNNYFTDSDSTSQDESEDEDDYLNDYDTGCFIRLPRKAYAAQKIQSCVRGYMVRKKCAELYALVKSAQICLSETLAWISGKIAYKATAPIAVLETGR